MKVKTKLIGSFIGIVSVCGLTMAIPLLVSTFKSLRQNIHQIARLEIEQINSKVSAFLEPPLESIDASLNFIDFSDLTDKTTIERYLKKTSENQDNYSMIYLSDTVPFQEGGFFYSSNSWVPPETFNQTKRSWFFNTLETENACFSDPYIDAMTGEIIVTISKSYRHGEDVKGVVGLDLTIDTLNTMVNDMKLTKGGTSFLIDKDGNYITNPDYSKISNDNFWDEFGFEKYEPQIPMNGAFVTLFDHGKYFAARKMPLLCGWTLVTFGDTVEIYSALISNAISIFSIVILSLVLATVVGIFLAVKIVKPIYLVSVNLNEIASGNADLTKRMKVNSNDEVGAVSKGFNTFIEKLHEIIKLIMQSKDNLIEAGTQLSNETAETSSSISQIISNINSINSQISSQSDSVRETAGAVNQIASNIESLEKMIETQASGVTEASAAVEQMIGNINSVNSSVEKMAFSFDSLQSDAQKGTVLQQNVNEKISQIDEESRMLREANAAISSIAGQTNLLAMNAAIEAAHAGEAGKGFSVVADEIRKLSETSATQSKQIGEQLTIIQNSISAVVEASSESSRAFNSVSSKIRDTDEIVRQIKGAMEEQQAGSRQITDSLHMMNDSTSEVRIASVEMAQGNKQILSEIQRLQDTTLVMTRSMEEMSRGAERISQTGTSLSEVSGKMSQAIADIGREIDQFKI